MSTILHQTLSHHTLHPKNLGIIQHKKSWLLNLDVIVLSDSGNVYDAMFMAARAALWDAKVPRTRSVEYKAKEGGTTENGKGASDMDVDVEARSGFDTRQHMNKATDFELSDYWDEGDVLDGRDKWPVCVTLNLVCASMSDTDLWSILNEFNSCRQYITWMLLSKRRHLHRFDFFLYSLLRLYCRLIFRPCGSWAEARQTWRRWKVLCRYAFIRQSRGLLSTSMNLIIVGIGRRNLCSPGFYRS